MFFTVFMVLLSILTVAAIYSSVVITPENHYSFITMFGKYRKTLAAGLGFKIPFITSVDQVVFLGLQNQTVDLSLKTKDQVTFEISLNIQYKVSRNHFEAYKSVYNIDSLAGTLIKVATNSAIPVANKIELEDVYDAKEKITDIAETQLTKFFERDYGLSIMAVLSDEPKLPQEVEASANAVVAAKREQDAAKYKAEAIRIEKVGEANADGESVKIRMEKLGEAREEYALKSANAVELLVKSGASPREALAFLSHIGDNDAIVTASRNKANTIVISQMEKLSSSNGNMSDIVGVVEALKKNSENKG